MHPRIVVHGLCGWTASLEEDLTFWAHDKIDYVSVAMSKLDAAGREAGVELVRASGVRVCHVVVVQAFDLERPEQWERQRQSLSEVVDTADRLDAERICLTAGSAGAMLFDEASEAFVEAIAPVRTYADEVGIPFVIEHNHIIRRDFSFLNSLRSAVEFSRDQSFDICLEVQNCWLEGHLRRTIDEGIDSIKLVQLSDWAKGDIALPTERAVLGDGDLPLTKIMGWLLEAGYQGPFEIEVVGPKIEAEGYQSAVRRSVAWLDTALAELGV
jgi:sugar phosphate isomerase/epimerase